MVCKPHQYTLFKMASYTPMGYNTQSLYDTQTQTVGLYNKATAMNYNSLGRYTTQNGYNTLGNKTNIGQNYVFDKTPELNGSSPVDSFKPKNLNDLVESEEEKVELIFIPTPLRSSLAKNGSYEVMQLYQPKRGTEQSNIGEKVDRKEMDQRGLKELIEKELKQFKGSNVQVQYV